MNFSIFCNYFSHCAVPEYIRLVLIRHYFLLRLSEIYRERLGEWRMRDQRSNALAVGSMALLLISVVPAHAESDGGTFGFLAWDFGYGG